MSDEESTQNLYKDGDVVWVKLSGCWWPGEITERPPDDYVAKKPPLAIVKFFNEDSYEFVRNDNNIYPYNCEKKNDFIRKGMDSFRANNTHMAKFPGDVSLAEILTDGNPNILSDPQFSPQKKLKDIVAQVFGTPATKKERLSKGKGSGKTPAKKPKVTITHRRFLGCDDYEAHIRVQYPGKDNEHLSDEGESEEIARLNAEPTKVFNCPSCPFNTTRIQVMFLHVQCHFKWIGQQTGQIEHKKKKQSPKKKRAKKKVVSDNEEELLRSDTDEEVKPKAKRKKKMSTPRKPKVKKVEPKSPETSMADIRSDLLAEWTDSEENDENAKLDTSTEVFEPEERDDADDDVTTTTVEEPSAKPSEKEDKPDDEKETNKSEEIAKEVKSCFDFDEEDEEESPLVPSATTGRKIPRVIPPAERRKSSDMEEDEPALVTAEDDLTSSTSNDQDLKVAEEAFKDLMEATAAPDMPDAPEVKKIDKDFLGIGKTVKIPDKEVATKLTNPKKRFVKSFEDFELLQNEQRRAQEEKEEELRREKADKDKEDKLQEKMEAEEQTTEVEVERKKEETENEMESEQIPSEKEDSQNEVAEDLQISKLKSKIMSKLGDEEETTRITRDKRRTPRSKILESYKYDNQSDKVESVRRKAAPKKSKILKKFNQQTKEETEDLPKAELSKEDSDFEKEEFKGLDQDEMKDLVVGEIKKCLQKEKTRSQKVEKDPVEEEAQVPVDELSIRDEKETINNRTDITELTDFNQKQQTDELQNEGIMIDEEIGVEGKPETENLPEPVLASLKDEIVTDTISVIQDSQEIVTENLDKEESAPEILQTNLEEEKPLVQDAENEELPTSAEEAQELDQKEETVTEAVETEKEDSQDSKLSEKTSDEEVGKVTQIDDYLNDFLFDFNKKEEPQNKIEDKEVHISNASNEDIAIKTNLTNFNKSEEEMSALSTLAMVSELEKANEEEEKMEVKESEGEIVPTDGNLTVVSEKELANAQVEIAATCKKPVTLTSFSMDYSDSLDEKPKEERKSEQKELNLDEFDFEDHIPSQIVDKNQPMREDVKKEEITHGSKLLERLTEKKVPTTKELKVTKKLIIKSHTNKIVKNATPSKPVILSEKIIKPVKTNENVSLQRMTTKQKMQDPDEIDTFIIQKGAKKSEEEIEEEEEIPIKKYKRSANTSAQKPKVETKKRGKAKILQQTIITPAGEIIQPSGSTAAPTSDDNVFDINSMPIVLSDQILTPESIENMPIYISDSPQGDALSQRSEGLVVKGDTATPKTVKKTPVTLQATPMRVLNKTVASPVPKLIRTPKVMGAMGSKIVKHNSFLTGASKQGKFVIVTQSQPVTTSANSRFTVGRKQAIIKRISTGDSKTQNLSGAESSTGNKIMILTDQQGQQQRVLLTPAQQKMMGYGTGVGSRMTKTVVKGSVIQKSKDPIPSSSGLITKTLGTTHSRLNSALPQTSTHVISPLTQKTVRMEKGSIATPSRSKLQMQSHKVPVKTPPQKTILIKNQHGQTVRKIQGTDDALLDKQVAEQLEAIKASSVLQQKQEILNFKTQQATKAGVKRSYGKKVAEGAPSPKQQIMQKIKEQTMPPLAPISPKKGEVQTEQKQERALHQLVIQDAMGNQTTITEGQILALPSETVDGQPQSYMLVTLDESGNLTPLNNEALLSLDPNLGLSTDLGNTVLQIDQQQPPTKATTKEPQTVVTQQTEPVVVEKTEIEKVVEVEETKAAEVAVEESRQSAEVAAAGGGAGGQQLIVTGDPIAAQKFLESLTEGNTDLANILASAEGSSILIHADGQQILINTDSSDNQMLLSVNTDNLSSEDGGNPIFATQPSKNQDILAAALADTDVFQTEQTQSQSKVAQLSPNSTLYPMNVSNVLETSLTLNSPIMTPLEVPSTKKISEESDILQVPKNVNLPITITDPNISQTVSQQQMVNELQNNLELSETVVTSADSPSFIYSLPTLDGAEISQKPFNSSMPLLTEDCEDNTNKSEDKMENKKISPDGSFLDESEGLCTLGGEMCSSLSEPPPDMFDLSAVLSSHHLKSDRSSPREGEKGDLVIMEEAELKIDEANEDSCEIPVQPQIVANLSEEEGSVNSTEV